jgi:uncharacterized protein
MELSKMKFFIIHGAYGNPKENWFGWLKEKLEKDNHEVIIPQFPTPEKQTLEEWMKVFEPYMNQINKYTIFIGHSLGPAFILSVLEKLNVKIKACFFVAGFIGKIGIEDFDEINKTFTQKNFKWERICENCKEFKIINSENDPYVKIEKGQELAKLTKTKLIKIQDAGHFNEEAGYTKFPLLLDYIKTITENNQTIIKNIDYKVPNGKLLRVYAEIKEGKVKEIKITGDFFVHPEAGIEAIEEGIMGEKIEEIEKKINNLIETKNIKIIGFEIKDLVEILNRIEKEK